MSFHILICLLIFVYSFKIILVSVLKDAVYHIEKEKKTGATKLCFLVKAAASGEKTGDTKCVS